MVRLASHVGIPLCDYFADLVNSAAKYAEEQRHYRDGYDSAQGYYEGEMADEKMRIKKQMFQRVIPELMDITKRYHQVAEDRDEILETLEEDVDEILEEDIEELLMRWLYLKYDMRKRYKIYKGDEDTAELLVTVESEEDLQKILDNDFLKGATIKPMGYLNMWFQYIQLILDKKGNTIGFCKHFDVEIREYKE